MFEAKLIYEFDNFRLDARNRELLREGIPVTLPAKAFDMLLVLLENRGQLVEKDELFNRVWPDQAVEESNLTVQISAIRKALGERKENPHYVATVTGHGYRFIGQVLIQKAEHEELTIERQSVSRLTVETTASPGQSPTGTRLSLTDRDQETGEAVSRTLAMVDSRAAGLPGKRGFRSSPLTILLVGLFLILLAGGSGLWLYSSRLKNQTRASAPPFAQTTTRQLTTKGRIAIAIISPDGKFYAYTLAEKGESKESLWLAQTDGSNDIQLRAPEELFYNGIAFSSDSSTLYYSTAPQFGAPGALYRLPLLGGVPQQVLPRVGRFYSLSPDDRQIAYFRANETDSALLIANLDGTGERIVLTRSPEKRFAANSPAWSPDGSMIAFAALNEGKGEEIFIAQVRDGGIKQLTGLAWRDMVNFVWQRNGQGLMAVAAAHSASSSQLWQIDYPTGEAHRISRDVDTYGSSLSISADSNSLLAVQERFESNIWVGPADHPAQARQVTFGSLGAAYGWNGMDWTNDGRIIFTGRKDQSLVIFSASSDGGNLRQLTSTGFLDEKPSSSMDGRFIVFQSNRSGVTEIWRANSDGSDLQQLTSGGRNSFPQVTPDSRWVLYASVRGNKSGIWRVPLTSGEPTRLTAEESAYPRVSADGKTFACTYKAKTDEPGKLALVPLEGGEPTKLIDLPRSAAFLDGIRWTPDGNALCYLNRGGGIWQQAIVGGAPQLIKGLPDTRIRAYGWSRDGKLVAFANGTAFRDVVLIGNVR